MARISGRAWLESCRAVPGAASDTSAMDSWDRLLLQCCEDEEAAALQECHCELDLRFVSSDAEAQPVAVRAPASGSEPTGEIAAVWNTWVAHTYGDQLIPTAAAGDRTTAHPNQWTLAATLRTAWTFSAGSGQRGNSQVAGRRMSTHSCIRPELSCQLPSRKRCSHTLHSRSHFA